MTSAAMTGRAFDLAAEFLADIADRPGPWQELFRAWAAERRLSAEMQRAIRVEILRRRCFGAVERFHGGAA